jgi:F-type H+-transporting ATPase subunit b
MEFNIAVFVLQLATFIIGMWLSSIVFLPYLKGWMEARQKRIENQLSTAEQRQKESEVLKADLEKKLKALEQKTTETLQDARKEANRMKDEIIQASRKDAELILSDARKAIENERQAVSHDLQKEVGTLAVAIAEKIIRASVDAKVQDKIVQEGIKELNANKN